MEAIYLICPYCNSVHHVSYLDPGTGERLDTYNGDIDSEHEYIRPCEYHINAYLSDVLDIMER